MARGDKKGPGTRKLANAPLPGAIKLAGRALKTIYAHWKPLGGIMLVYLLLNIALAGGLGNLNAAVQSVRSQIEAGDRFSEALNGFGALVSGYGASESPAAQIFQSILVVLVSLVIIWALRQLTAGNKIGVKQAYYSATAPLIPFLLVIVVIFIQLLPVTLGAAIIGAVLSTIFDPSTMLTAIIVLIFSALAALSLYLLSSSLMALYVVTLPDMQPLAALRSAKNLVKHRRLRIMLRVLFLPILVLLAMGAVVVPLILFVTLAVVPVFYVLSLLSLLFVHTYLYSLYRSLLE